ncbi:hypothetical protein JTE90_009625, partial [Oedothorax gibbosus]
VKGALDTVDGITGGINLGGGGGGRGGELIKK